MCCPAFRPKYRKLVDNIFPKTNGGGLVRSEMEKLTYYAVSAPEKLDRIGEYLALKLTRSINRRRDDSVFIAMEALDQLLLACHAQQINSFVESFLRMVASLLESDNLEFQALGTNSFIKFSNIEEDAVSYHRRYDFFVSKFSEMCHSNLKNAQEQKVMQSHGVRGIHGVIRKTVTDELQVNIWQAQHMEKIIPSLLYVMMQEQAHDETPARRESFAARSRGTDDNLGVSAEECLRELLSRASYSNVSSAVQPALAHLDSHRLWKPDNLLAIKCFKVFMFSVQSQYSHVIVKMLLDHLDKQDVNEGQLKANILEVLCAIVIIPSSSPIGPAVVEVFSQLTHNMRYSLDSNNTDEAEIFQTTFINTVGVLCDVLPDFQKLEAMVFFISKAKEYISRHGMQVNEYSEEKQEMLVRILLHCLYRISEKYTNKNLSGLGSSLLDPMIKVSSASKSRNRSIIQRVLIHLLDRGKNFDKLVLVNSISSVESSNLTIVEVGPQDGDTVERKIPTVLQYIYEASLYPDNTTENYVALFKCMSMICISIFSPDLITEVCRVLLSLQNRALHKILPSADEETLDTKSRIYLLNMVSSCFCVVSYSSKVSNFIKYVSNVMQARTKGKNATFLNPCHVFSHDFTPMSSMPDKIDESEIFVEKSIQSALVDTNCYKLEKITQPFVPVSNDVESVHIHRSFIDAESIHVEFPGPQEETYESPEGKISPKMITFDYLKRKFAEPPLLENIIDAKKRAAEHVMKSTFEQLESEVQSKTPSNKQLMELIQRVCHPQSGENSLMTSFSNDVSGSSNIVFPSVRVLR